MTRTAETERRGCGVHFRKEAVYVTTSSETEAGLVVDDPPVIRLAPSPTARELGRTVLKACAASRSGLPDMSWRESEREFIKIYGRPWRAFSKGAKYLSVTLRGRKVDVLPSGYDRGRFNFLPEHQASCGLDPDEIGRTVLKQLEFCT